jgi:hypothetical protein
MLSGSGSRLKQFRLEYQQLKVHGTEIAVKYFNYPFYYRLVSTCRCFSEPFTNTFFSPRELI